MGIYNLRDIGSTFSGDIQLDYRGDIKLANASETQKGAVNFWLRTDQGEYIPDGTVGSNLGIYIGDNMSEDLLEDMRNQVFDTLSTSVIFPEDIAVEAVPFDMDEAIIVLQIKGTFLNDNGEVESTASTIQMYTFPYITATPTPIVEQ